MSKYIIDLPDNLVNLTGVYWEDGATVLAKQYRLSDLVPYVESDRDVAEGRGWEFAMECLKMYGADFCKCFGSSMIDCLTELPYHEAKAKYEKWKKEKEKIRVGDEVWIMEEAQNGVVTSTTDSGFLTIIDEDGDSIHRYDTYVVKTGRHYPEIKKLLKEMRNDNEKNSNCC